MQDKILLSDGGLKQGGQLLHQVSLSEEYAACMQDEIPMKFSRQADGGLKWAD